MAYQVNIKNKINNYPLNDSEGFLFCLFESISNSLFSCIKQKNINITITIKREYFTNAIKNEHKDYFIQSLAIIDNGDGFTEENFNNFSRQIEASNYGGKGLGRLSYLKVFDNINIESIFIENKETYKRVFNFNIDNLPQDKKQKTNEPQTTKLIFNKIIERYKQYTKKDIEFYFDEIIKHFYIFLYYLKDNDKSFSIKINDDGGKIITKEINNKLLENDKIQKDTFKLNEFGTLYDFEITHIKTTNIANNNSFYVADMRSVDNNILKLPPTSLKDKDGNTFNYYVYLKSDFFNKFLNTSRTEINLPTEENPNCIYKKQILEKLQEKVIIFLEFEYQELYKKEEDLIKEILQRKNNNIIFNNSGYLPIIFENEENKKEFLKINGFTTQEKKILENVKIFTDELKERTIKKINTIIQNLETIEQEELISELLDLSKKVNDHNSIELTSYILYRKSILNLFEKSIEKYKNNKKHNEKLFHNLFFTRNSKDVKKSNMWLIDDSFLYFEGTSESKIEDIEINKQKLIKNNLTEEDFKKINEFNIKRLENRIDLLFFPQENKCIIMELKSPNVLVNHENILQLNNYVSLIAKYKKEDIVIDQFFTYFITENISEIDIDNLDDFKKIYNINGYVRKNRDVKVNGNIVANQYTEIISYNDIFKRATQRNNIFFEKLGIKNII
jgi:hypothetical protein